MDIAGEMKVTRGFGGPGGVPIAIENSFTRY